MGGASFDGATVMAGRPLLRTLEYKIEEAGGDEIVWDLIRSGMWVKDVAEEFGVHYKTLMAWVRRGGDERVAAYEQAKSESADALVERGAVTLENADETLSSSVQKANAIANYLKWLAGKRDKTQYGDGPQTQINVDLGGLHLNALREAGQLQRATEPEAIPAEIVESE